jgi:multiple sugar transport system substrate-binding protein
LIKVKRVERRGLVMKTFSFVFAVFVLIVSGTLLSADLRLVSEVGIHTEAWKALIKDFTDQTDINIEVEQIPYAQYFNQLLLSYTSGRGDYDVPYISLLWYPALAKAGYISPISDIPGSNQLNFDDIPGISNAVIDGKVYLVPFYQELGGIVYRTDLFNNPEERKKFKEQFGYELQPPETLKQYLDVAKFFYRPPDLYGVTLMGQRSIHLVTHFMQRLWAMGGQLFDSDMKPVFNSDVGIAALENMKEFFKYASPSSKNYVFQDALSEFENGKSAMAEIWTTALFYANNPDISKVAGKVSFAGFPRDEKLLGAKLPMLYITWGFAISSSVKDKEKALEWIKFATKPENEIKVSQIGCIPARLSALDDSRLIEKLPWLSMFKEAIENCIPTPLYPLIPEGQQILSDYLAPNISDYLSGVKTAKQALDDAANGVYKLLEEQGYYKGK